MCTNLLSYLQHYAGRLIVIYHLVNDWLEEVFVTLGGKPRSVIALEQKDQQMYGEGDSREQRLTLVINAISERHIETVITATLCANFIHVTWPGTDRTVTPLRLQKPDLVWVEVSVNLARIHLSEQITILLLISNCFPMRFLP